jgi:hypothetical protein
MNIGNRVPVPVFNIFNYHKIDNIELCLKLVDHARLEGIPSGGDAEAAAVIYCAPTKAKVWSYEEMTDD